MITKKKITKQIISIVLCLTMLLTYIPLVSNTVLADDSSFKLTSDPSTMDDWKKFFGPDVLSTENAGGVWMDKSVFTTNTAFANTGITLKNDNSFLVALSAIASNMVVTGMSNVPTDTMLILDVSGSMNDNSGNNDVAEELVASANQSIATLFETNANNRVGVVLYSGSSDSSSNYRNAATLLLPLGSYTTGTDKQYLTYTVTGYGSTTETVGIDRDVVYTGTTQKPTAQTKDVVGATYIQRGIITAMNEFVANGNETSFVDPVLGTLKRTPVIVLMSDGAPSLGSTNFTDPGYDQNRGYNMGTGSGTSAALGFVSQLSAAYAKAKIEEKYGTDALFYTLGLGLGRNDNVAISVMDPDNTNASTAVDNYWNDIQTNWRGQVTFAGYNHVAVGETVSVGGNNYVTKISTPLEQNYVDGYFPANTTNLINVFKNIISEIQLQTKYFPTLVSDHENFSGYVSFVDKIGEYMDVTDIKGVLIHNTLFSGAMLASNFADGKNGGLLGTPSEPTALGHEMVVSVMERLGLPDLDTARTLIDLAHQYGQLSYTDEHNFSNYIGWYANAEGKFLGFWHEGMTTMPEATGNTATDPAFIIKSYGLLGEVDAEHGVTESDMMHATIQIRENIKTGEQTLAFAIPAALIPIVTYNVTLDEQQQLTDLTVSGATSPIRLVYEVSLEKGINEYTLYDKVSANYIAANTADGAVNFYTNQFELNNTTGYGTINTYSYFNPSKQNDRYYYLEDTLVYADDQGTLYTGATKPANATYYRQHKSYVKNGNTLVTKIGYHAMSADAVSTSKQGENNTWYVPAGTVFVAYEEYITRKSENETGTLGYSNYPFVDTQNHELNDPGYYFYVGATLGNNGKIAVTPATGIKLTKEMQGELADAGDTFDFVLSSDQETTDGKTYEALLVGTDGEQTYTDVTFNGGKATVTLKPGQTIYIGGMTAGNTYTVEETATAEYAIVSVNGNTSAVSAELTLADGKLSEATFVNAVKGKGNLTVSKELIPLNLPQDYQIPAGIEFEIKVTLSGVGVANETFRAEHTNGSISSVTTNANGEFTLTLEHGEQFEVFDIPEGTLVEVEEQNVGQGFSVTYWSDPVTIIQGPVKIVADVSTEVIVVNNYRAQGIPSPVDITVGGTKILQGRDWNANDEFTFELQRWNADESKWEPLAEATVKGSDNDKDFAFANAFANESYDEVRTYFYRIVEIEPTTGALGGVTYDKTVHSFGVIVTDKNLDGYLEIDEVRPYRDTVSVTKTGNAWTVDADFTNVYSATGSVTATIDINKKVTNDSGSSLVSLAGFTFGLYNADGSLAFPVSAPTTDRGFTRLVLNYTATGTFKYTLKEIVPDDLPDYWKYSEEAVAGIPVTVVVSDNQNGGYAVVIYEGDNQSPNAATSISLEVTNVYDPKEATLKFDFVSKELSGRDLVDKEFDFVVIDKLLGDTVVLYGKNDVDGKVNFYYDANGGVIQSFDGSLTFDRVGMYYYTVKETSTDGNGVTVDKTVYDVIVNVTDQNGQLVATYEVMNEVTNNIVFKNVYNPGTVSNAISGEKLLDGRVLLNDEFKFVLTEALNANGDIANGAKTWEALNGAVVSNNTAKFTFESITYTAGGKYYYVVTEVAGNTGYGIVFDNTKFIVTVEIEDNGEGSLSVKGVTYVTADGKPADKIKYVNVYDPEATTAQVQGDKVLEGAVLGGGDFKFDLYEANDDWTARGTDPIQWASNDADGKFSFKAIDFDAVGSYRYLVKERNEGKEGITYDDSVYHVVIEVTDDLVGSLKATVNVYDENGIPQESIVFVNTYTAPTPPENPETSDGSRILFGMMFISALGAISLITYNRKRRIEE